jgi:ATP-dependent DNA ligase
VAIETPQATGVSSKRLGELHKEGGDWGDVAQSCRSSQGMLVAPAPLTVAGVYGSLRKIADERGDKSTARKQATVRTALLPSPHLSQPSIRPQPCA